MTPRALATTAKGTTIMKRWTTLAMCAAMLLVSAPQSHAAAGPVIDWDPAYMWQPGGAFNNLPAGGIQRMVGTVSGFGAPLAFLNANIPAREYTFVADSMVSLGTVTFGPPSTQIYQTDYTGGVIRLYEDVSPDAVFAAFPPNPQVPSTFEDGGAPLLVGYFTRYTVTTNNFTAFQTGSIEGDINWVGGTLLPYFQTIGGAVCPGLFTGGATWNSAPNVGIPGYLFRHDGKIDLQCPTPTSTSTWGRLKQIYR